MRDYTETLHPWGSPDCWANNWVYTVIHGTEVRVRRGDGDTPEVRYSNDATGLWRRMGTEKACLVKSSTVPTLAYFLTETQDKETYARASGQGLHVYEFKKEREPLPKHTIMMNETYGAALGYGFGHRFRRLDTWKSLGVKRDGSAEWWRMPARDGRFLGTHCVDECGRQVSKSVVGAYVVEPNYREVATRVLPDGGIEVLDLRESGSVND